MESSFTSEPYQYDSEVPLWRSTVDVAAILKDHGQPGAADLLTDLGMIDPDDTANLDQWVVMTGRFLPLLSNNVTYSMTFSPGMGDEQAVVLPIVEAGQTIDLLAVSTDDSSLWGCVTGNGSMAGTFVVGEPVRVYKRPWQWLLFGCDGVIVLAKDAYSPKQFSTEPDGSVISIYPRPAKLADCSVIYAESLVHADDLLYRLFERPAVEDSHPALRNQQLEMADSAVAKGSKCIGIDTDRYDLDAEIEARAVDDEIRAMEQRGCFA